MLRSLYLVVCVLATFKLCILSLWLSFSLGLSFTLVLFLILMLLLIEMFGLRPPYPYAGGDLERWWW